jgi:hypothetical protein
MVIFEVGGDSASCLPGKGRSVQPSLPGAMGNPSIGLPIMVCCRSDGPLRAGTMMTAPEPPPRGERLRPLNWSVMNSRLPKRMVSPGGKPSPGERSPLVTGMNTDDGTIGMA